MAPSVERGGKASEKSGAAPPVVIEMPDEESHIGVNDKVEKGSRIAKYAKNFDYFRFAKYQFALIVLVAIVVLIFQVNKGKSRCQPHRLVNIDTNPRDSSRPGQDPEAQ